MVSIIDCGPGNLGSIHNLLEPHGVPTAETDDSGVAGAACRQGIGLLRGFAGLN
jgi:hypothetical protein